jgi:hypothetical protein
MDHGLRLLKYPALVVPVFWQRLQQGVGGTGSGQARGWWAESTRAGRRDWEGTKVRSALVGRCEVREAKDT